MNRLQLVGWGIGVFLVVITSFLTTFGEPNTCSMSYSRPVYHKLDVPSPYSLLGDRYSTHLYREGGISKQWDGPESLGNTPVLFLPGNAGSYNQGRSIASLAANLAKELQSDINFDFFLIHFDEDFSALLGQTLSDQGKYVNDAIYHILELYAGRENAPQSVILICHSMGGIAARIAVTSDNYVPHSINTIYTLSTPHLVPPLTMDRGVTEVYDKTNQFWRQSFTQNDDSRLDEMTLVSISGGHTDFTVPPEYTPAFSVLPSTHGISAYSYSIPNVWRGQDHLCIVWCYELRQVLVESLFAVTDPKRPQRTIAREDRIKMFEHYFKSPLDDVKLINSHNYLVWQPQEASFDTPIGPMAIVHESDAIANKIPFNLTEEGYVSTLKLLTGITIPMNTRFLDIPLPSLQSSLLSLKFSVQASDQVLALRHWVPSTGESRWYASKEATVFWYSSSPFVPYPAQMHNCLHLQVVAPTHNITGVPIKVHIRIDLWSSLANFAVRYRTIASCFPAGIVLLVVLIQLHAGNNGKAISFRTALDVFVKQYFVSLLVVATMAQYLLCFSTFRNIVRGLQIPSERANIAALSSSKFDIADLFAGIDEPILVLIAPLLLIISTTAVIIVEQLIAYLVWYIFAPINRLFSAGAKLKGQFVYAEWLVLTALVVLVPHQCVFVGTALVHIFLTTDTTSWKYTTAMVMFWTVLVDVPIIAVWGRDLHFKLNWDPSSNIINVASSAPSVAYIYLIHQNKILPNLYPCTASQLVRTLTYIFIGYFAYYALMHGFMHTFMMHYFANFLAGWFMFVTTTASTTKSLKKTL